jgi:hypothetical protein
MVDNQAAHLSDPNTDQQEQGKLAQICIYSKFPLAAQGLYSNSGRILGYECLDMSLLRMISCSASALENLRV